VDFPAFVVLWPATLDISSLLDPDAFDSRSLGIFGQVKVAFGLESSGVEGAAGQLAGHLVIDSGWGAVSKDLDRIVKGAEAGDRHGNFDQSFTKAGHGASSVAHPRAKGLSLDTHLQRYAIEFDGDIVRILDAQLYIEPQFHLLSPQGVDSGNCHFKRVAMGKAGATRQEGKRKQEEGGEFSRENHIHGVDFGAERDGMIVIATGNRLCVRTEAIMVVNPPQYIKPNIRRRLLL
jgi:hypothetical protein